MSKKPKAHSSTGATRPSWFIPVMAVIAVVVIVGAVLLLSRGNPSTGTAEVTGKPNLVVDKTEIDFGDVRFEKPVTAVFTLINTGDKPLQILQEPRLELLQGC